MATTPSDPGTPAPGRPSASAAPAGAATVGITYLAALLLGALVGAVGAVVPCSGFLCSIGNAIIGASVGVLASAVIAALVARRDGVRWWYTPIAYGIPVAAVAALPLLDQVFGAVPESALWVVALCAPVLALAAAGPLRPWVRGLLVALVAIAVVVAPLLDAAGDARRFDERRRSAVATWRTFDLPVHAPVGRADITVNALGVSQRAGGGYEAWYDMAQPDIGGEARVWMELGPEADTRCDAATAPIDLGDGIAVLGDPADPSTICRTIGDAKLTLWQDGSEGDWTGARLVELARDLQATDGAWLEGHLRRR